MSATPSPLDLFVRDALAKGESRDAVGGALRSAGWPDQEVTSALASYADTPFSVPVPRPRASLSAREAFLYLVLFTSLYISVYSFGHILFAFIDKYLPDVTQRSYSGENLGGEIRWGVSSLIVAFPVFLWTSNYIGKRVAANTALRLSPARRWCTYLTLFIAVSVLIGDGTWLVNNLLGGELTSRFVLKALVVGGIAASALLYYLHDLRHEEQDQP
ncbi:MAG: DUF5671 domain-containing protein [Gemmatimonadota bacterium]|nr:DUF5671 domain-containing protein [Gemmatimonadota bacterium]